MKNHIAAKGHVAKDRNTTKDDIITATKNNDTTKSHTTSSMSLEQSKSPSELSKSPEPSNKLNKPPEPQYLSKYGFMRESYLKDHKPKTYNQMIQSGELKSHCLEVQQQAKNRLDFMMRQMVEHNPPPSRNDDGLAWAAHMNMLKHSVEEVIFTELIYV